MNGLRSRGRSRAAVAGLFALGALVAIAALVAWLPDLNPFATQVRDRSQPALMQSLTRLSEYRAARANLQQVVDIEKDAKYLPSFVKGERVVMVAVGNVDATVDFRHIGADALRVSPDRRAVTITLPAARLAPARLDLAHSRIVEHDRGVIDRTGELLGAGNADEPRELLLAAEDKLAAAATADRALLPTAERNTTLMLQRLARGLGFERVMVRFQKPAVV